MSYGDLHFRTQTEARAFLNAMLNRYDIGDRVSAADAVILRAALVLHPEAKEKIGSGIRDFSVRSADFGTKCFWINRTDGTTEKFSHKACV
ncbi:DCL family protein [Xanthobacter sp. ZOL 2024]